MINDSSQYLAWAPMEFRGKPFMTILSLHQSTTNDVSPLELTAMAAQAGYQQVSLFLVSPAPIFQTLGAEDKIPMAAMLRSIGVRLGSIESFMITPGVDVEAFRPAFKLGSELGASTANTILFDPDRNNTVTALRRLCDLAAEYKLNISVEFMAFLPKWNQLSKVLELMQETDRNNLKLGLDVLHLVRSGTSPEEVAAIPTDLIAYLQLCDSNDLSVSADYAEEATFHRLAPGEGRFPLGDYLRAVSPEVIIEVEAPGPSAAPTLDKLTQLAQCTTALLLREHTTV